MLVPQAATRPQLPADPPPRLAAKESEASELYLSVQLDKAYAAMWDEKKRDDRDVFLTVVSEFLITESTNSQNLLVPVPVNDAAQKKGLLNALAKMSGYLPRTGTLPEEFVTKTRAYLEQLSSEPRRGLWAPEKPGAVPKDFTALAYFINKEKPEYLREFLAARNAGPIKWESVKDPARPYFVREKVALERLAMLTTLTAEESARLVELKSSKLGDQEPEAISLKELLSEYASNEVRADDAYKGHVVEFSGIAGGLQRGTLGGINLTIGTGKTFERPEVTCFFDQRQTEKVKAINKGERVRVKGKVSGLMVNVVVDHCELVN